MSDELQIGHIQFYDNYVPSLTAGNYSIVVKQSVNGIGLSEQEQGQMTATQDFVVYAPQFSLDPSEIHSMVPPLHSTGQFADELPHIVLNKRILPWERTMSAGNIPWLALLVFQEGELAVGPSDLTDGETGSIRTTVGQYLQLKTSQDVYIPSSLIKEKDVTIDQPCSYIRMSTDLFKQITPYLSELPYLAHVREINTGDKAVMGIQDDGWFSVVAANRLPHAVAEDTNGTKNIVHLVSLEGMDGVLTSNPAITQSSVALISLARWSFHCLPDNKEDFAGLMHGLVASEMNGGAYSPDKLRLRLPQAESQSLDADPARAEAQKRMLNGFVPIAYHTRSGEETFAWYRGPLAPVLPAALAKPHPFFTADAALIYDPANGLFDASLASAWEIGRSLALADATFGKMLLDYRRGCHRLTDRLYDTLNALGLTTSDDLTALAASNLMQKAFLSVLEKDLLNQIPKQPMMAAAAPARTRLKAAAGDSQNAVQTMQQFLSRDDVQQAITQLTKQDLEPIAQWLARKQLLYEVPFNHLVSNASMLPAESIRFFYVDPNWLDAMLDGMLAIAMHSSRDSYFYRLTKDTIRTAVTDAMQSVRDKLRGKDTDPSPDGITHLSGFLLRSAVVAGWPGLSVRAYDREGNLLKIVRLDHLSPNVLLVLFWGIPERLELSEPQEGFQFGVNQDGQINLRSVVSDNAKYPFGSELSVHLQVRDAHLRTGRVLDLRPGDANGLVQTTAEAVKSALQMESLALSPSDFALQMVKSPERIVFLPPSANH